MLDGGIELVVAEDIVGDLVGDNGMDARLGWSGRLAADEAFLWFCRRHDELWREGNSRARLCHEPLCSALLMRHQRLQAAALSL